jgi:hypothetical protein
LLDFFWRDLNLDLTTVLTFWKKRRVELSNLSSGISISSVFLASLGVSGGFEILGRWVDGWGNPSIEKWNCGRKNLTWHTHTWHTFTWF